MKSMDAKEIALAGDLTYSLLIKPLSHTVQELLEWGFSETDVREMLAYSLAQGMARYDAGQAKSNAGH